MNSTQQTATCVFAALLSLPSLGQVSSPSTQPAPQTLPEGLTPADWAGVQAAHAAEQHAAIELEDRHVAHNPGQGWTTEFDGESFLTEPHAGGWSWGLKLEGFGRAGAERRALEDASVDVEGSRVSYRWDAQLTEWYVNDRRGLEHGYTLSARPEGQNGGLEFDLSIRGDLRGLVSDNGRDVRFVDEAGNTILNYAGLLVFDSVGQEFQARFDTTVQGLRLTVDDGGALYPLTIDPVAQQAYIKPFNTGTLDFFGTAIAVSGDTLVVGAQGENGSGAGVDPPDNDDAFGAGAAYVFVREAGTWVQQAYLKASNPDPNDAFGFSVAIDGDTIAVGARQEDSDSTGVNGDGLNNLAEDSGAVYVFVRNGQTWSGQDYIKASNTGAGDQFGWSVALQDDTLVVGAVFEDSNGVGVNGEQGNDLVPQSGAAYVFEREGTSWTQTTYLKQSANDLTLFNGSFDLFGAPVALDGDTLAVAATREDSGSTGVNGEEFNNGEFDSGAVYIFIRSGDTWVQQAYIKASNTEEDDAFGTELALQGDTLVVAATGDDTLATGVNGNQTNNSGTNSGAAFVFTREGGTWSQEYYVKASNTDAWDSFGRSLALSGEHLLIGAQAEDSTASGINGDQTDNGLISPGAAYLFRLTDSSLVQEAYIKASNPEQYDFFGIAAAMSEEFFFVGALGEGSNATGVNGDQSDNSALNSGAVYAFTLPVGSQIVRLGTPANPNAFVPDPSGGPVLGTTWSPFIDHSSFLPSATADLLGISTSGATNVLLAPFGTLLCEVPILPLISAPAVGAPFSVAVPNMPGLIGLSVCSQGLSIDTVAGVALLTNAIDLTVEQP